MPAKQSKNSPTIKGITVILWATMSRAQPQERQSFIEFFISSMSLRANMVFRVKPLAYIFSWIMSLKFLFRKTNKIVSISKHRKHIDFILTHAPVSNKWQFSETFTLMVLFISQYQENTCYILLGQKENIILLKKYKLRNLSAPCLLLILPCWRYTQQFMFL